MLDENNQQTQRKNGHGSNEVSKKVANRKQNCKNQMERRDQRNKAGKRMELQSRPVDVDTKVHKNNMKDNCK